MKRLILAPDSWPQAATAGKSRQELETVSYFILTVKIREKWRLASAHTEFFTYAV